MPLHHIARGRGHGAWMFSVLCCQTYNALVKLSRFGTKSDVCVLLLALSAIMFILIIDIIGQKGPGRLDPHSLSHTADWRSRDLTWDLAL